MFELILVSFIRCWEKKKKKTEKYVHFISFFGFELLSITVKLNVIVWSKEKQFRLVI